ncbi:MAG: ABC transporter permease [Clostridiales bacterium]|nr:ABC transporter permease [Clostridiales bacterium]
MTSTTLSVDKKIKGKSNFASMLVWTLRKNTAVSVVYTTLLFVFFPLMVMWATAMIIASLSGHSSMAEMAKELNEIVKYGYPVTSWLTNIFAIIISGLLFNYLHNKRSVDMYNALPISRKAMYFSKYVAGLLIITVPVIVTHFMGVIILTAIGACAPFDYLPTLLYVLLSTIATYTFTSFLCVCSGKTSSAIILSIGLSCALPIAVLITNLMITSWVPGFQTFLDMPAVIYMLFSPESIAFAACYGYNFYENGMTPDLLGFTLYFVIFAAALAIGGYFVYKKRKMECAQSEASLKLPEWIIRVIVTYGCGLSLGFIFSMVFGESGSAVASILWFWIGVIFATASAHIVLEVILNKGFKNFVKNLKIYAVSVGALVFVYVLAITGLFGGYAYVPAPESVSQIEIKATPTFISEYYFGSEYENKMVVSDSETIGLITDIHSGIVDQIKQNESIPFLGNGIDFSDVYRDYYDSYVNLSPLSITYKLKGGGSVTRYYSSDYMRTSDIYGKYKSLLYSKAFIDSSITNIEKTVEQSNEPTVSAYLAWGEIDYEDGFIDSNGYTSKVAVLRILEALKEDISDPDKLNALKKYEKYLVDYYSEEEPEYKIYCLDIGLDYGSVSIYIPEDFRNTIGEIRKISK